MDSDVKLFLQTGMIRTRILKKIVTLPTREVVTTIRVA
jgi:hypothetical protein